jgi:hypothetical protein
MNALAKYLTSSTLKREYALVLTIWWMVMETWLLARAPITETVPDAALSTCSSMFVALLTYSAATFGADWISKQTNIAGPPANTQTTVATTVTDNTASVTTTSEEKP